MKRIVTLLFWLCASAMLTLPAQTVVKTFSYAGKIRTYRLHVPKPFPSGPMPLVFSIHGFGSNALEQEFYSQFSPVADTNHFLVVYPEGVSGVWDVGLLPDNSDDVGFISSLIDTVAQDYQVDLNRVYSCGFSLGGYMTYRLGCEITDRLAAIAPVSGLMANSIYQNCTPSRRLPLMHIHGTADDVVPTSGLFSPPVDSVLLKWVGIDGCVATADTFYQPNLVLGDSSTAIRYTYPGCSDSTEVIYWEIEGAGHTWPGAFPLQNLVTNFDINATREIWDFFSRHRNPAPRAVTSLSSGIPTHTVAYWSPEAGGVTGHAASPMNWVILDLQGKVVSQSRVPATGKFMIQTPIASPGFFLFRWETATESGTVKLLNR